MNRTIWVVARRELSTRVRTRAFAVGTAAIVLIIAAYSAFLLSFSGGGEERVVGFVGQAASVEEPLRTVTEEQGSPIRTRDVADRAQGEQAVRDGELDAVLTGAPDALTLIVEREPDPTMRAALDSIVRQLALDAELAKQGIEPAKVRSAVDNAQVGVRSVSAAEPDAGGRLSLAMAAGVLLYMFLVMGGQTVAQGVVEEKSTRVVELLLSTIRPFQLLTGKVLGIGLTLLLQFAIISAAGTAVSMFSGMMPAPPTAVLSTLSWALVWLVLGFFFYATILATAGSLVSRVEDLHSVIAPVMMLLIVPFIVGVVLLTGDPHSPWGAVLSQLPGFSPVLMPMRIALGVAAPWEMALSVVVSLLATFGALTLAARIYSYAVLHMGARVKVTDVFR